jgi:GAF domain-containing protein
VNDVSRSGTHRPNPLLPDTKGELALPLLVGDDIIGALDVQSTEIGSFRPDDVRALEIVAGQLATAVEKTRLVTRFGALAEERRTLLEETQTNLRQIEELNRRLTREGWRDYLRSRRERGAMGYTIFDGSVERDDNWTASMRQAYQGERSVVITKERQAHIAALPVRVRGEVIGVLEFERGGEHAWTDDDLNLAQALVDRLAIALDNARLFEQAYTTAHREQLLSEITQSVQMSESVEDLLQAALAELGHALGASRGVVQISPKREKEAEEG